MVLPGDDAPDAAWFDTQLRRGGWIDASVTSVSFQPLGEGVGLLGSVLRATLTHEPTATTAGLRNPRSVILKRASTQPMTRSIADYFGYYEREAGMYRDLLPRPGVAAPACYAVDVDPTGYPILLLEDLGGLRSGDQVSGASPDDAFAAAELLGALHAAYWEDSRLRRLAWLPGPTDSVIAGYGSLFDSTWPTFVSVHASDIDAELLDVAPRVAARFDEACRRFANGVTTLVHGDFRLDNLLFADDAERRAVAVDWQLAALGRGPYDLAFFTAGSLDTDTRRRVERDLVEHYHQALKANGVAGYRSNDCWDDYRWGHVLNLPNPITAAVAVDPVNERGAELLAVNAARALAAVADHWG